MLSRLLAAAQALSHLEQYDAGGDERLSMLLANSRTGISHFSSQMAGGASWGCMHWVWKESLKQGNAQTWTYRGLPINGAGLSR